MKRYFVDTNIIIDVLANRQPYSKFSIGILAEAQKGACKLYTSTHTIATCYYVLKKYNDEKNLRNSLMNLLGYISLISVTEKQIIKGLRSSFGDFEDAIQIFCAMESNDIDGIITRNLKDFKSSPIQAFSPEMIYRQLGLSN